MARKAWFKVCWESLRTVFTPKRNPPLSKSLPVLKWNTGFILPLFLVYGLLSPVNGLLMWSQKDKQIYIHTNTHFSESDFNKPGTPPQPAYGQVWTRAWFKKTQYQSSLSINATTITGRIVTILIQLCAFVNITWYTVMYFILNAYVCICCFSVMVIIWYQIHIQLNHEGIPLQ